MGDDTFEDHIQDELDFARALTALLLAIRLENAERKAELAYERVLGIAAAPQEPQRRSA